MSNGNGTEPSKQNGHHRANSLAVSSQKGGVGKTTTCLSLAASLVEQGLRVLVVDLDPQAHLTQALAVDPDSLRRTVGDALLYQSTLMDVSRETVLPELDLAPANRGLILVEKMLHTGKGYEFRLKTALQVMDQAYYDWILFDCPPSFGPLTINALAASDQVLIPVTCDYFSMQSLHSYMRLLGIIRQNVNPVIVHRLLITLYDSRTRLSRLFLEQYRAKFKSALCETLIPLDAKLRESALFTQPITRYAAHSRSADEYRSLARELMLCQKATI